ncbi:MAG: signal peptidase II [Clostridia bacterium]|nr:signal peptidase II [Clostridia bacterium]MCI9085542.1 signal peptidase II [Clostridia bacterium]
MIWLLVSLAILAADQIVKYLVSVNIGVGETAFSVLNIFDVTYVQNQGAAFSVLSGRTVVLSVISVVFCIAVAVFWIKKKPSNPLLCTSLSLLFAGALGNGIDRIFRGYVVDYINLTFINFPVFNIADIGVTVGAALFILYIIFFDKEDKNGNNNA